MKKILCVLLSSLLVLCMALSAMAKSPSLIDDPKKAPIASIRLATSGELAKKFTMPGSTYIAKSEGAMMMKSTKKWKEVVSYYEKVLKDLGAVESSKYSGYDSAEGVNVWAYDGEYRQGSGNISLAIRGNDGGIEISVTY